MGIISLKPEQGIIFFIFLIKPVIEVIEKISIICKKNADYLGQRRI